MEDEKVEIIKEAVEKIRGLENAALLELTLYIDELAKIYEDRHKA